MSTKSSAKYFVTAQTFQTVFTSIIFKVRTFWETHKIKKKNLPHGFDKSADLLGKRQNHEDFFKLCVLLKMFEPYNDWQIHLQWYLT